MDKQASGPSLVRELGGIASLYKTVFYMFGQRAQHGPAWEDRLRNEALLEGERRSRTAPADVPQAQHHPLVREAPVASRHGEYVRK